LVKLSEISSSFAGVVREVAQSVVTITTVKPKYDLLLGVRPAKGVGSGFIVSGEGVVVTNSHVVGGAAEIVVVFPDGSREEGAVIAVDRSRDLALLKVARGGLKPLKLGDSDALSAGEIVFAIGSPLGLPGPTVTMGVVSAIGRTIVGEGVVLEDLIQTDAAINPGNSGGPLINAEGEVVGVTTAMIPYAQGVGFAIPINTVKRFIHIIARYGRPLRAFIGVYVASVTPDTSTLFSLPVSEGVVVVKVIPGSPAHEAGLRVGDVIVRANGREVRRPKDLKESIEDSIDRGVVVLRVIRWGAELSVKVPIVVEAL